MDFPEIETADFGYPGTRTVIEYVSPELTAVCPKTGLPDFYTLRIIYVANKKLPELKSLKMYLNSYRNFGIWHEHLANKIIEDFAAVVKPRWAYVELKANPRGGVYTTVRRVWASKSESENGAMDAVRKYTGAEQ